MKATAKKTRKLIILLCLLVALLSVVLASCLFINSYLNQIPRTDETDANIILPEDEFFETDEIDTSDETNDQSHASTQETVSGESEATDSSSTATETTEAPQIEWPEIEPIDDSDLINILLVGQDRREHQGRSRSDTMILCSINTKTKEVSLISFMRDLYVPIPGGYSANRLNAPYLFAGFPLLNSTLTANFGISIDYNIEVDFSGFIAVINAIGGIEITLTAEEAEYLSNNEGWGVEGVNHVNGVKALTFARLRKLDSDFQRTERQREVLQAILTKVKNLSLTQIISLAESIFPYLTTDMNNNEIISLLTKLFPLLSSVSVSSYRVPALGTYYDAVINKMAVLVPDLEAIRELLVNEYLPLN